MSGPSRLCLRPGPPLSLEGTYGHGWVLGEPKTRLAPLTGPRARWRDPSRTRHCARHWRRVVRWRAHLKQRRPSAEINACLSRLLIPSSSYAARGRWALGVRTPDTAGGSTYLIHLFILFSFLLFSLVKSDSRFVYIYRRVRKRLSAFFS